MAGRFTNIESLSARIHPSYDAIPELALVDRDIMVLSFNNKHAGRGFAAVIHGPPSIAGPSKVDWTRTPLNVVSNCTSTVCQDEPISIKPIRLLMLLMTLYLGFETTIPITSNCDGNTGTIICRYSR